MNFDNLMHYELMTGLYMLIRLLFCSFDFERIHYTALRNSMRERIEKPFS